ncbi:MAG: hypothetical protein J6Q14_01155 [Oscillospiraceae bacterium]|nr:hypothetical protein [Oscillospiraceae bacterium]
MFTLSLNRVHDRIRIVEGDERLELRVDGDPMRMVAGLNEAQKRLRGLTEGSPEEEQRSAAQYFAAVMFGEEQARALMEFYHDDAACVINVCGRYFSERLAKLIARAQKRAK